MPHPKNRLKLTGDTHPPELEYDLAPDSDDTDADTTVASAVARRSRLDDAALRMEDSQPAAEAFWLDEPALATGARHFARTRPLASAGIALVVGYTLLKVLRR
ncbi:MAG: hypothetical protein JWP41_3678 [Ramlibacter sp.]|nr:hypothetical protein [Ramlibacter sp.]